MIARADACSVRRIQDRVAGRVVSKGVQAVEEHKTQCLGLSAAITRSLEYLATRSDLRIAKVDGAAASGSMRLPEQACLSTSAESHRQPDFTFEANADGSLRS